MHFWAILDNLKFWNFWHFPDWKTDVNPQVSWAALVKCFSSNHIRSVEFEQKFRLFKSIPQILTFFEMWRIHSIFPSYSFSLRFLFYKKYKISIFVENKGRNSFNENSRTFSVLHTEHTFSWHVFQQVFKDDFCCIIWTRLMHSIRYHVYCYRQNKTFTFPFLLLKSGGWEL